MKYGKDNFVENSTLHNSVKLGHFNQISNSTIDADCSINASVIEDSVVGCGVEIGPFAHIRPNSNIGDGCRIGNYVEIKNSTLGKNTKVAHLAYVGDAVIGDNCNIGCGVIFANYNGKEKNKIVVGNNVFIGSNSNLVAPVIIGDNVYICAGSTVTKDINSGEFVIARSRETIKPNRAKEYLKRMY